MPLHNLPYDLLLNVAQYLDLREIHALQLTCKTLHEFTATRPVYRDLAFALLRRCRPLPLTGFQRLSDLTTEQLVESVNKASRFERAWRIRGPRPAEGKWYKVVSAPPNEEVDWLSPITSSYTLCATKSGKVVCWDVPTDKCLAEWNPGEKWELWKCRVEFEQRAVFFTMAKLLTDPAVLNDERVMKFILMRLTFPELDSASRGSLDARSPQLTPDPPIFSQITSFKTAGVVMNVFLLDPPGRLLACFVWVSEPNTIGLYTLLDWDTREYAFIDTGIECLPTSNWSCILHDEQIVIHSEEADAAFQHFYPISLLSQHKKRLTEQNPVPTLSGRVCPPRTQQKRFVYPPLISGETADPTDELPPTNGTQDDSSNEAEDPPPSSQLTPSSPEPSASSASTFASLLSSTAALNSASASPDSTAQFWSVTSPNSTQPTTSANPFPSPPWYPESAHFVRQWWPTLAGVPRVSCTVILMAAHDPDTHHTRYAFAQHYFRVPFNIEGDQDSTDVSDAEEQTSTNVRTDPLEAHMMRMWYVSTPFEVVSVNENMDDEAQDRSRPLVAVDFGHASWVEYRDTEADRAAGPLGGPEVKCLRFVTFPPMGEDVVADPELMEGVVRTLDVPEELDLDNIETINIDQSQGAVILSSTEGKIYFLFYT